MKHLDPKASLYAIASYTILFILLLCASLGVSYAQKDSAHDNLPILRIGASASLPPYQFLKDGKPAGFDVEMIKAVAHTLGYRPVIRTETLTAAMGDLRKGRIDVIAGLSDTRERHSEYSLSLPICVVSYAAFVRQNSNMYKLPDLRGKTIVIPRVSPMTKSALQKWHTKSIVYVPADSDALVLLNSGRYDAAVIPKAAGMYYIENLKLNRLRPLQGVAQTRRRCFAVKKGNRALLLKINEALQELEGNEEYQRIYDPWFGLSNDTKPSEVVKWLKIVLGALVTLLLISTSFSYTLRRVVRQRTAELKHREYQYRLLSDHVQDMITRHAPDGRTTYVSPASRHILGYEPEEIVGLKPSKFIHSDDLSQVMTAVRSLCTKPSNITTSCRLRRKDGTYIWVETTNQSIGKGKTGGISEVFSISRDITERKRTEEALAAETERLMVTLRSIGDGVISTDVEGRVVVLNRVAEELTGWKQVEAFGHPLEDIFYIIHNKTRQKCVNPALTVLQTGNAVELMPSTSLIARDGTERIIADSAAPIRDPDSKTIGVVLVFRDVTAETRLQEELQRTAKLESLGILAGGIAHDFNNLLTAITGNVGMSQSAIMRGDNDRAFSCMTEAERAAIRARDLTQQLMTFARGGAPLKKVIDVTSVLHESISFALTGSRHACNQNIEKLSPILADAGQITQVLQNLLINADQSMPEASVIDVFAKNCVITENEGLPLHPGSYVSIGIQDHGVGIPRDIVDKVFDPFFTTKQRGNGLGLASVHSITKAHDGHITVTSSPGTGSLFTIYLPVSQEAEIDMAEKIPSISSSRPLRILVMDDEEILRRLITMMLEEKGHTVECTPAGDEAIEAYRSAIDDGRRFDLVILDLTIPGSKGGKEVVNALHEIDPTVRAIASSGYATDPIMSDYEAYGFIGCLAKPYRIKELHELIDRVTSN